MSPAASASSAASDDPAPGHDPYAVMRLPAFRKYWSGNLISLMATQMQIVAVEWEIYDRTLAEYGTKQAVLALTTVAFTQFLPVLLLSLPAGQIADRLNRKSVVLTAQLFTALGAAGLAATSLLHLPLWCMYACVLLIGTARVTQQPSKASLLPHLVPRELFSNAVTWSSSGFQLACIAGPALAGGVVAFFHSYAILYVTQCIAVLTFFALLASVHVPHIERTHEGNNLRELLGGFRFIWHNKIILGALSLDLFAVLLGGATTLLKPYSEQILHVGDMRLGWLRAAPAVGAIAMSIILAHRPPMERAGRSLLWAVAGFGVATIVFGISRNYWLSLAMLFLTGALDMISVVVRHTLVQMLTPDEMRGRVQGVNGLFIGASNELGGCESGMVAWLFDRPSDPAFGLTVSVVSGGLGTMAVVAYVALRSPRLRRYGRIDATT
ncbi:MAG TPA: MFS transporter [Planctomycetaceae bacterium]|nr:MFS transporter [Planctomycetaceae bacterium]